VSSDITCCTIAHDKYLLDLARKICSHYLVRRWVSGTENGYTPYVFSITDFSHFGYPRGSIVTSSAGLRSVIVFYDSLGCKHSIMVSISSLLQAEHVTCVLGLQRSYPFHCRKLQPSFFSVIVVYSTLSTSSTSPNIWTREIQLSHRNPKSVSHPYRETSKVY